MSISATSDNDLDLVWGASGIRRALRLDSDAQVYALLKSGELDGVVKRIGSGKRRRICASVAALRQKFEIAAA